VHWRCCCGEWILYPGDHFAVDLAPRFDHDGVAMTDLAALARRVEELEKQQSEAREQAEHYKTLYQEMLQRCAKLERGIISQPKSERMPRGPVRGGNFAEGMICNLL
jgi:hypothetical protein